jgi:hypothetical protein
VREIVLEGHDVVERHVGLGGAHRLSENGGPPAGIALTKVNTVASAPMPRDSAVTAASEAGLVVPYVPRNPRD